MTKEGDKAARPRFIFRRHPVTRYSEIFLVLLVLSWEIL
jgi:hypothetical protein